MSTKELVETFNLDGFEDRALVEYRQMVADIAEGAPMDDAIVAQTLAAASKTFEQLKADVARVKRRVEAAELLAREDEVLDSWESAAGKAEQAFEEYERIKLDCDEKVLAAKKKMLVLNAEATKADQVRRRDMTEAKRVLRETADIKIAPRLAILEKHLSKLRSHHTDLENYIREREFITEKKAEVQAKVDEAKAKGRRPNLSHDESLVLSREINSTDMERRRAARDRAWDEIEQTEREIEQLRRQQLDPLAGW